MAHVSYAFLAPFVVQVFFCYACRLRGCEARAGGKGRGGGDVGRNEGAAPNGVWGSAASLPYQVPPLPFSPPVYRHGESDCWGGGGVPPRQARNLGVCFFRGGSAGLSARWGRLSLPASHPSLGDALRMMLMHTCIPSTLRVKSLGVGLAAGIARNTKSIADENP